MTTYSINIQNKYWVFEIDNHAVYERDKKALYLKFDVDQICCEDWEISIDLERDGRMTNLTKMRNAQIPENQRYDESASSMYIDELDELLVRDSRIHSINFSFLPEHNLNTYDKYGYSTCSIGFVIEFNTWEKMYLSFKNAHNGYYSHYLKYKLTIGSGCKSTTEKL